MVGITCLLATGLDIVLLRVRVLFPANEIRPSCISVCASKKPPIILDARLPGELADDEAIVLYAGADDIRTFAFHRSVLRQQSSHVRKVTRDVQCLHQAGTLRQGGLSAERPAQIVLRQGRPQATVLFESGRVAGRPVQIDLGQGRSQAFACKRRPSVRQSPICDVQQFVARSLFNAQSAVSSFSFRTSRS